MKLFFRQWIEDSLHLSQYPLKKIKFKKANLSFPVLDPESGIYVADLYLSFIIASSDSTSSLKILGRF